MPYKGSKERRPS